MDLYKVLEDAFVTSKYPIGRAYIAPNGMFVATIAFEDDTFSEPNHATILDYLYDTGHIESPSYSELEERGYVRVSNWDSAIILPKIKPTEAQYRAIRDWIDTEYEEENMRDVLIDAPTEFNRYSLYDGDIDSKYVVDRIRRYYATNILYESINEEVTKIDSNRAVATMNDGTQFNIWTEYESNYDQTDCMKIAYVGKNWMDENDRVIKDNLLGYIEYAYDPYESPRTAYVKMIEVKDSMRRKGIGTALIQALQKDFGDNINYGYSTPDGTKLLKSMRIMESFKNDSTVFYVGKTEVLKNPSDSEYRQLYNEQRKLHPNTNEPLIRQTFGEFGNYYVWPAYDSTHYSVELYIYKNFGERTNQNKDYEMFNHYYLDEDLEHPFPNSKIKQVVYHTSNKDFDKFDSRKKGSNTGWVDTNLGYFFSDNKEITKQFGNITKAYYINLRKPLDLRVWRRIRADSFEELNSDEQQVVIDLVKSQGVEPTEEYIQSIIDGSGDFDTQAEIREQLADKESIRNLRRLGYDSIIDTMDSSIGANEYIVFNSNQIKVKERLEESLNSNKLNLSEYNIKNILINNPDLYRILYDARIDKYMIGNSYDIVHRDLLIDAYKKGYYESQKDFIETFGAIDNYMEVGMDGYYDKELSSDIDPFLYFMVFIPKGREDEIESEISDGYNFMYEYDFGYVLIRLPDDSIDFTDITLYDVLGKPNKVKYVR